ncbi:MAG: TetR/AcrR family transcriptional regulator [Lachnospiraceae bacterium]|nr:TetR/AcrR family transcriptional regulator [Lachnospiraceae bacterium]
MDHRKAENKRVKNAITESLFTLMHQKSLQEISISEIIRLAGVARCSFYRNYKSKEDVLITLVRDILEDFRASADYDLHDYTSEKHIRRCIAYFKRYKNYVLDLLHSGFGTMLLDELNHFHEAVAGDLPADSPKRYRLYIFIGALYNTMTVWLQEENPLSEDELVKSIVTIHSPSCCDSNGFCQ